MAGTPALLFSRPYEAFCDIVCDYILNWICPHRTEAIPTCPLQEDNSNGANGGGGGDASNNGGGGVVSGGDGGEKSLDAFIKEVLAD